MQGGRQLARNLKMASQRTAQKRLPSWFRTKLPSGTQQAVFNDTMDAVKDNQLHTVCQEAKCPNIHDCWSSGDATFMIAGKECTRGCRFCAVGTRKTPPPLDVDEPSHLADAVGSMNLRHAVITVVNRDDLEDSAADHYKQCLAAVAERCPEVSLELLCSDLAGDLDALYWFSPTTSNVFLASIRLFAIQEPPLGNRSQFCEKRSDCAPTY